MPDNQIILPGQGVELPGREIQAALHALITALANQYPRATPDLMAGFVVTIRTSKGIIFECQGGAQPGPITKPGMLQRGGLIK